MGQYLLPRIASHLDFRFRQRCYHHATPTGASRLCKFLDKGNEIVEGAGGKPPDTVEFLGISHQLIHEDKTRSALVKHIPERFRTGRNAPLICVFHIVIELGIFRGKGKLRCDFAPKSVDGDTRHIGRPFCFGRIERRADDDCHLHIFGKFLHFGCRKDSLHIFRLGGAQFTVEQMIKSQHTMGLAAAERSFKLNDRLPVAQTEPTKRLRQQSFHSCRYIGTGKEFHRVEIFGTSLATRYLGKVSGELCLPITSLRYIRMRTTH